MVKVNAPRFEVTECNTVVEREFIELLHARSGVDGWCPCLLWTNDDRVVMGVDIADGERNLILRSLRIEFTGDAVTFGEDETYQFVTDLRPNTPGTHVLSNCSVPEMANTVADWLLRETRRAILYQEWSRVYQGSEYVFADEPHNKIVCSGFTSRTQPPDRVTRVKLDLGEPCVTLGPSDESPR